LIDVYTWATPNGHKVHIMLEETELPYKVIAVDIGASEQFKAKFLKISPNNKIPAIVDHEGPGGKSFSLFESGAILLYLAEKTKKFLPRDTDQRYHTIEWLMFQMGGIGPMLGQAHHFRIYAPKKIKYAIDRYTNEANRLYSVLDRRLKKNDYLAGDKYTIADMATWPWLRSYQNQGVEMDDYPSVKRWFSEIGQRPAVQRAIQVLADRRRPLLDAKAREVLFGATQYQRRK
jgi:GSH-dependent disulfide-bond oxidoreductase